MTDSDAERRLWELNEEECRELLGTAVIGRIAFTEGALPAVQPVHFTLLGGHVYIPTRPGSKVAAAIANTVVAFEADDFDPRTRTGWSVTTIGQSRLLTDDEETGELDALGLRPWASTPHRCYIAVHTSIWHGRRLVAPATTGVLDEASLIS
jgi:nitroimidazol reductase NimA-like FMN-containing flavoprotein (pyridoxamine 5'-phosphate oxidase superfamily)